MALKQEQAPTTQATLMPSLIGRQVYMLSKAQTECSRLVGLLSKLGTLDPYGLCPSKGEVTEDELAFDPGGTAPCMAAYVTYAGSPWQKDVQQSLASVQSAEGSGGTQKLFTCLVDKASLMAQLSPEEVNVALAHLLPTKMASPPSIVAKTIGPASPSADVTSDITGSPALLPGEDCPTGYYRPEPASPCEMLPLIPNGMAPPGQVDPSAQLCAEEGGTWDEANYNCITPTNGGECRIVGMKCKTAAIVGGLVVVGGIALLLAGKRRKKK
jgi:hypothetical protein